MIPHLSLWRVFGHQRSLQPVLLNLLSKGCPKRDSCQVPLVYMSLACHLNSFLGDSSKNSEFTSCLQLNFVNFLPYIEHITHACTMCIHMQNQRYLHVFHCILENKEMVCILFAVSHYLRLKLLFNAFKSYSHQIQAFPKL